MVAAISMVQDSPVLVGADDDASSWGRTLDLGDLYIRVSPRYITADECAIYNRVLTP